MDTRWTRCYNRSCKRNKTAKSFLFCFKQRCARISGVNLDENFTPKQVASALSVSESSVKRWCDRGDIRTDRTIGGHRRIPLDFLLEFLEATNRRIVNPVAIGFERSDGKLSRISTNQVHQTELLAQFEKSLISGAESECRRIISSWYASQGGIASLADNLLSPAFRTIGEQWKSGQIDIYQERRGCEISRRLVFELRRLLPEPTAMAPLAMGGTPPGDQYQISTLLTEMVFREQGWRTESLGSNIPFDSLLSAARKHMPRIFWLSISHVQDNKSFLVHFEEFTRRLPKGIMLVVGGRALTDDLRPKMVYSAHCDGMEQLATLIKTLK